MQKKEFVLTFLFTDDKSFVNLPKKAIAQMNEM